ncbi:MAG TPA: carbon-nitrogen hydrolase family protein [Anaerolineales bacterium]|nr:carbon-nitrogen hydrolase family protein [Anaerolineales bacterium]
MKALNIALLQMTSNAGDMQANLAKGEAFCRQARRMGADIALFPEMWNVGYSFYNPDQPLDKQAWIEKAIDLQSDFIQHFIELARSLYMAIGLTYLEKWEDKPRNTITLIDRYGQTPLTYAKVHTCSWDKEDVLTPGQDFQVCALDTAVGEVNVGAMICFDREFPESARLLMLKGAEIILTPNACELEINRISQFRARAYENMVGVAMTNYAAPDANGHSLAFDGIAFDAEENSRDMLLVQAGEAEGIYLARFDLDRLRAYRAREVWGNAYRRPQVYTPLTSTQVDEPFQRKSSSHLVGHAK